MAEPMRVCGACGVIAPLERQSCSLCDTPFERGLLNLPSRPDDAYWVCLRAEFRCVACTEMVPLNHLDDDGRVLCVRCGLEQQFDADIWKDALELAQQVGDLSGPNPEGRSPGPVSIAADNERHTIGVAHTSCSQSRSMMDLKKMTSSTLNTSASPGFCLCARCKIPVDAQRTAPGRAMTRCPKCAEEIEYSVPENAAAMVDALVLVVADEHRAGRPIAKVVEPADGGVAALSCPSCGAALPYPGESALCTCPYCSMTSLLPGRARYRATGALPKKVPWWVLFTGPSKKRLELEAAARKRVQGRVALAAAAPPSDVGVAVGTILAVVAAIVIASITVSVLMFAPDCSQSPAPPAVHPAPPSHTSPPPVKPPTKH